MRGEETVRNSALDVVKGSANFANAPDWKRCQHFVVCGSRNDTYDSFRTAVIIGGGDSYPLLLVDSEDPLATADASQHAPAAWAHLQNRDGWSRPLNTANDQAQLMVTCMETWVMGDQVALKEFFGGDLRQNRLLAANDLEDRTRHEVQESLEMATSDCGPRRMYRKGKRSFQVLATLDPMTLRANLPHFRRFMDTLKQVLA